MRYSAVFSCSYLLLVCSAFPQTGFTDRNARYRIQPSDVIEVHFRYSPELDQTAIVQPDGFISVPTVGDVRLQGLTMDEAKQNIVAQASKRLRNPEITLVLKEFEKPYFIVGGEVGSPGRFELHGSVNALEAIAIAGGFKAASAKHSEVILYRRVGHDLAQAEILDLRKAMQPRGRPEPPVELRSGDMLMVPANRISKIERFIRWANVSIYPPL